MIYVFISKLMGKYMVLHFNNKSHITAKVNKTEALIFRRINLDPNCLNADNKLSIFITSNTIPNDFYRYYILLQVY